MDVVTAGSLEDCQSHPFKKPKLDDEELSEGGYETISNGDSESDSDSDPEWKSEKVQEELRRYNELIEKYKGFRMDKLSVSFFGRICPLSLDVENCGYVGGVYECVRHVIQQYNDRHKGKEHLELVKVVRANASLCSGVMYYITFDVEEKFLKQKRTYQAKVRRGSDQLEVLSFDLEPENQDD